MKSDRKDIYNVKKNLYFKQMLGFFFLTLYLSKNAGKNIYKVYHGFHQKY